MSFVRTELAPAAAPDELSLFVARLESTGAPYMVTGATAAII